MAGQSISALVAEAISVLREAGIEEPGREARWLLYRILAVSPSEVIAHPGRSVTSDERTRYLQATRRRAAHEPFAYVVGERELYGRSFMVDRRVLVPRPETEILIEEALRVLRGAPSSLVVDVGTGSGAIACTLALEAPGARVVACDLSDDALAVAAGNRDRLGLRDRLPMVRGSLLSWLREPADLVVANLPYIPAARVPTLMPEVSDWEPHLALDGGPDGLDLIRDLLADAQRVVRPGGTILLELDPEQMAPARALLPAARATVIPDLAGLDRVLRFDLP